MKKMAVVCVCCVKMILTISALNIGILKVFGYSPVFLCTFFLQRRTILVTSVCFPAGYCPSKKWSTLKEENLLLEEQIFSFQS